MSKIPVGSVIGQSYRFAFAKYFSVLGIVWLPTLIILALAIFAIQPILVPFFDLMQRMAENPDSHRGEFPVELFQQIWRIFAFEIVAVLIVVIIRVGIVREALGLRTGPRFVYFSFGVTELRVIGAYILAVALLYAVFLAVGIVIALLGVVVGLVAGNSAQTMDLKSGVGTIAVLVPLLMVFVELAVIYVWIRLTYFIVPVTVAEQRFGIGRSWELTRGNFWRIVVVSIAVLLPIVVLECIVFFAVVMPNIISMPHDQAAAIRQMIALMKQAFALMPYFAGVALLISPIVDSLVSGPAAFAYRALAPANPAAAAD